MALSVILRQCSRIRGSTISLIIPNLLRSPLHKDVLTRNYTQIFGNGSKNPLILNNKTSVSKMFKPVQRNMSADHSKLWPIEKLVSLVLLGVVPAAFLTPNAVFDNVLAVATVVHFHWGLEACVVDYVRPIIVGPVLPKVALLALYAVSVTTLAGLLYFNYNDIGIGQAGRKLWAIKS